MFLYDILFLSLHKEIIIVIITPKNNIKDANKITCTTVLWHIQSYISISDSVLFGFIKSLFLYTVVSKIIVLLGMIIVNSYINVKIYTRVNIFYNKKNIKTEVQSTLKTQSTKYFKKFKKPFKH